MARLAHRKQTNGADGSTFSSDRSTIIFTTPRPAIVGSTKFLANIQLQRSRNRAWIQHSSAAVGGAIVNNDIAGKGARITVAGKTGIFTFRTANTQLLYQSGSTAAQLQAAAWTSFGDDGAVPFEISVWDTANEATSHEAGGDTPDTPDTPTPDTPTPDAPASARRPEMAVVQQRRDIQFVDQVDRNDFATSDANLDATFFNARSRGSVHPTFCVVSVIKSGVSLAKQRRKATICYTTGPEAQGEHVIYRLVGAFASNAMLELYTAIGPAAPAGDAAGQQVVEVMYLDCAPAGQPLIIDRLVALEPWSQSGTLGRAAGWGITIANGTNANMTAWCRGSMSVQRVVGPPPPMLDRRYG